MLARAKEAEARKLIERQINEDMPKLFNGYVRAFNIDQCYRLLEHTPLLTDLKGVHAHEQADPVSTRIFNSDAFFNYTNPNGSRELSEVVFTDLLSLKCCVTAEPVIQKRPDGDKAIQYICVPHVKTGGTNDKPEFERDSKSAAQFCAYLMAKTYEREPKHFVPLATPQEIVDAFGHNVLMDALKKERVDELKEKLDLDLEKRVHDYFVSNQETSSKILTYMMAHKQITAEEIGEKYGQDMLYLSCSRENINWFRSLRGMAPSGGDFLEQELPHVHKYMKGLNNGASAELPPH
jgi:hypothetical protein